MSKRSCIKSRAIFGYDKNDKKHRYLLERIWDYNKNKGMASVILFNPSNADELKYDRTTMEIINYLIGKNKYNGVFLLNLYSIVELDSKKVIGDNKKIDKDKNDKLIGFALKKSKDVYIAWGSDKDNRKRINEVKELIKNSGYTFVYKLLDSDNKAKHPSRCKIVNEKRLSLKEV